MFQNGFCKNGDSEKKKNIYIYIYGYFGGIYVQFLGVYVALDGFSHFLTAHLKGEDPQVSCESFVPKTNATTSGRSILTI